MSGVSSFIGLSYASRTQIIIQTTMSEITPVPSLSLHPSQACIYNSYYYSGGAKWKKSKKGIFSTPNTNTLTLSNKSALKLSRSLDYLIHLSSPKVCKGYKHYKQFNSKLSFITLTLSSRQTISDTEITHALLNQFITEARKRWNMTNYVWRAERQKNLNIHYHIITDVFIPWSELRNTWNRIQQKLGIIDQYRNEMKQYHNSGFQVRKDIIKFWPAKAQHAAFVAGIKSNWSNPNSVDIHSLRSVEDVYKYCKKYMTKSDNKGSYRILKNKLQLDNSYKRQFKSVSKGALLFLRLNANRSRLWSCSYSLSKMKGAKDIIDHRYLDEFEKLMKLPSTKKVVLEHATIFYFTFDSLILLQCTYLLSLFSRYIVDSGYYPDIPPPLFSSFSNSYSDIAV